MGEDRGRRAACRGCPVQLRTLADLLRNERLQQFDDRVHRSDAQCPMRCHCCADDSFAGVPSRYRDSAQLVTSVCRRPLRMQLIPPVARPLCAPNPAPVPWGGDSPADWGRR
jgi:hypothetical protein